MEIDPNHIVLGVTEAPEIFVDGYRGAISNGQIVKLNFFSNRLISGETTKVGVMTLVTSISDFVAISEAFQEFMKLLQDDGVISIVTNDGDTA